MATIRDVDVVLLDEAASGDVALVTQLADLANDVYADAERGLWQPGTTRTTAGETAELIAAGELAVATRRDGSIVGTVHVREKPLAGNGA